MKKKILYTLIATVSLVSNATSYAEPSTDYDCVVTMDKMRDLYDPSKGWPVQENDGFKIDEKFKSKVLGVIGTFNVGKTWLINKLTGYQLPSDTQVHTKGYGFVSRPLEGHSLLLLDTEGLNSFVVPKVRKPVTTNQDRREVMLAELNEIDLQEDFRKEFTENFSDVFIFVTGQMSFTSQTEILKICKYLKDKPEKKFVIVHNMKEWTLDELKHKESSDQLNYIDYISAIFNLGNRNKFHWDSVNFNSQSSFNPRHHFLVQDKDPRGQQWNENTVDDIKSYFEESLIARDLDSLSSHFIKAAHPLQNNFAHRTGTINLKDQPKRFVGTELTDSDQPAREINADPTYQVMKDPKGTSWLVITCKVPGVPNEKNDPHENYEGEALVFYPLKKMIYEDLKYGEPELSLTFRSTNVRVMLKNYTSSTVYSDIWHTSIKLEVTIKNGIFYAKIPLDEQRVSNVKNRLRDDGFA